MSNEKVLLIAGDAPLAQQVERAISDRTAHVRVVDPGEADGARDALFDAAFDMGATSVLLIDPLPRHGWEPPAQTESLLSAALRAVRSPMVTGFGWISAQPGAEAIDELKQRGKPFGILRPAPLIEIAMDEAVEAKPGRPVLVDTRASRRATEARAVLMQDAVAAIADWVEREGMRAGSDEPLQGTEPPLERAVRKLSFEPVVLSTWRVELNRVLGMTALEQEGPVWRIRRRPLFRKGGGRVSQAAVQPAS